jgi:GTP-binding protein Era
MSFRSGHVAVVGRPNVGKSTLVNALVGHKVSIVAPKPQTTRHRILGIATGEDRQIVLIDTPGLHSAEGRAMSRQLNRTARGALGEGDVVLLVAEAARWNDEDEAVLAAAIDSGRPVVLALNKVDLVTDKGTLLPKIAELVRRHPFAAVVPVSARQRKGLDRLADELAGLLPEAGPLYDLDDLTDRSERFLVGELIREQVMRQLHAELPYAAAVVVDTFEAGPSLTRISASILVERDGQKGIVIGAGGARLKSIGTAARLSIERLLGTRVFLELAVRVRESWSDDEVALRQLGYGE